jgi:hypothetical protein
MHLDDVRFNVSQTGSPGHRYPMVAVQHKIYFANFVNFNGGQTDSRFPRESGPDAGPALLILIAAGQKGPSEIGVPAHTSHNGVERNFLDTALGPPSDAELASNFVVRQEFIFLPGQTGQHILQGGLLARILEIAHGGLLRVGPESLKPARGVDKLIKRHTLTQQKLSSISAKAAEGRMNSNLNLAVNPWFVVCQKL